MNQTLRQLVVDNAWMGLTALEMTGIIIAFLAVALLLLSSIQDFADLWNAT